MIKRYNNLSFLFFIPGIIAQIAGIISIAPHETSEAPAVGGLIALMVGTLLAMTGFGFYAKAKGRSAAWGVFGFLGMPGLVLLAILKDRSGDPWNT